MALKRHTPPLRPGWWPDSEPWPPMGPHRRGNRDRFFRRAGCLLAAFACLALAGFLFLAGLISTILRLMQFPHVLGWALPLAGVLFVLSLGVVAWTGRGLRQLSRPFGDFLEAADRVADGDYSARVSEQGPREVRSVARAFNTMASRLQVADEHRRGLLSDVTHELRTPLTVIQGNVEGMLDGVYSPDQARLKLILEETQLLGRLVDDLRTLALTESGALVLRREPTDLAELINETAAAFRSQSDAAGLTICLDVPTEMPRPSLDPARVRQVLLNLISNAVRYTPTGGTILVRCKMLMVQGHNSAVIEVEDTGRGIAPEDLPHVFDRFYKARASSGRGLGLSIAKSLIEAHGGTITAGSQFGRGTTIRVILPVRA
jgi:two-component system, OmpR family, sensor histidine kinase BaeS